MMVSQDPQMAQEYNRSKIFEWMAELGGLKNISQFKVQVLPDQQVANMAQAGNIVPPGQLPGGPTPGGSTPGVSSMPGRRMAGGSTI